MDLFKLIRTPVRGRGGSVSQILFSEWGAVTGTMGTLSGLVLLSVQVSGPVSALAKIFDGNVGGTVFGGNGPVWKSGASGCACPPEETFSRRVREKGGGEESAET